MSNEPLINVGILNSHGVKFTLNGDYRTEHEGEEFRGQFIAKVAGNKVSVSSDEKKYEFDSPVEFTPDNYRSDYFTIYDVPIGIKFHWERKEKQSFRGSLKFIVKNDELIVINKIPIETYLLSVISSEMNAKSGTELLKAHAVISRSWLLAQIEKSKQIKEKHIKPQSEFSSEDEFIKWYDREDHEDFDVCADDHCQRYQGIKKIVTDAVRQAVHHTRGMTLCYGDEICDARFSKSCGGISETFENVWENSPKPYLVPVIDSKYEPDDFELDLTKENNAVAWIKGSPPAFCNTTDKRILAQVLLEYDQETTDFYRWKREYKNEELSQLIMSKGGPDFGNIRAFIPVERGASGRLIRLKIVGSKKTLTVGKELEIRRWLSPSHLYSSAFFVENIGDKEGFPEKFIFYGAGWGHGVGLCQIGAAVMAEMGYNFDEILLHYYRSATIKILY